MGSAAEAEAGAEAWAVAAASIKAKEAEEAREAEEVKEVKEVVKEAAEAEAAEAAKGGGSSSSSLPESGLQPTEYSLLRLWATATRSKCPPSLAAPQLAPCACSGRAWWPRAARHSQSEAPATGTPSTASAARASRLQSCRFLC